MHFIHIPKTGGTSVKDSLEDPQDRRWQGHYPAWYVEVPKKELWTIVRNPYDRAISIFINFCDKELTNSNLKGFYRLGVDRLLVKTPAMRMLDSQSRYLCKDGRILVPTRLRFEKLEQEMLDMFDVNIGHENKADRDRDWKVYYDKELREIVYNRYKDDFRNFNYAAT